MIELPNGFPANVLGVACHGIIIKHDYDNVLVKAVDEAIKSQDKLRF
jgi:hypothetical protein